MFVLKLFVFRGIMISLKSNNVKRRIIMQVIIVLIFIFLQIVLCSKARITIVKYLPFIFLPIGYLMCVALWFGAFDSFGDVVAKRWLAIVLLVFFSEVFIGCLIGLIISKVLKRKK